MSTVENLANLSIKQIDNMVISRVEDDEFLLLLSQDHREGVRRLYRQVLARREKETAELLRLTEMTKYERELWCDGVTLIAGLDEAGRGPLAGPVAAGAVILPPGSRIIGLNDSKKLSEKKREQLFEEIDKVALAWNVGMASPEEIDAINILQATYLAMQRAIEGLSRTPQFLLIDALKLPGTHLPQKGIIGGDGLSLSIAAASVMAKVTRDRLMKAVDVQFPQYGFAAHKGYGTQEHMEAIKDNGLCNLHRKSFCRQFV